MSSKITQLLEPYSPPTQEWIVNTGIEVYERSQTLEYSSSSAIQPEPHSIQHYLDEIAHLRTQLDTARTHYQQSVQSQYLLGRQEEHQTQQTLIDRLQQELSSLQEENARVRREMRETREKGYKEGQQSMTFQLDELTQSLDRVRSERTQLLETREQELYKMKMDYADQLTYLRQEVEREKREKREIYELRDQLVQETTSRIHDQYTSQLKDMKQHVETMETQIQRYQELYEATNKGIEYEKLITTRMEEYNHTHLGNQWDIQHVGQITGGGKGDIQLVHRMLGVRVLIDLKNKNEVGKQDIQKFLCDVENTDNQCDIGMLIARGRIYTKRLFHMEQPKDKPHIYISNFKVDHIGMLFSSLDMACEQWQQHQSAMNMDDYRKHLKNLYIFFRRQRDQTIRETEKMKTKMTEIGDDYYKHFKQNIELDMEQEKKTTTTANHTLVIETAVDGEPTQSLAMLEKTSDVIGKRTKYALLYTEGGKQKLQYFRGNHARQKKKSLLHSRNIEAVEC